MTHGTRQTPHRALIAGSALGFVAALAIHLRRSSRAGWARCCLNMAVFGAVIAYVLQMVSFIRLRVVFPIDGAAVP